MPSPNVASFLAKTMDGSMEDLRVKPFQEIQARDLTSRFLQDEMSSRGYLLIRGLLPNYVLGPLLREITQLLYGAGWLLPDRDPLERMANISAACGDPDQAFKRTYQEIFNLELFHALPHHPALKHVMNLLVGERLLVHPKPIGRLIFPHYERLVVRAHQDYRFMDGDPECFTVWTPLHDCPISLGPLQILERLASFRVPES